MNTYEFQPVSEPDSHLLRLRPSSSGGQGVTGAEADRFADVKAADDSLHQGRLDLAGAERRLVEAQKALDQASKVLGGDHGAKATPSRLGRLQALLRGPGDTRPGGRRSHGPCLDRYC